MVLLVGISILPLTVFWFADEINQFNKDAEQLRDLYLESQKLLIKTTVDDTVDYITYSQESTEARLKRTVRARTEEAFRMARHLTDTYGGVLDRDELEDLVRESLRSVRFHNGRGYYFAIDTDGYSQLFAVRPEYEGRHFLSLPDENMVDVVSNMIRIVETEGRGFYEYRWMKPGGGDDNYRKIAYIDYFEPFDWIIGTGEYVMDVRMDIQREVISRVDDIRYGEDGYMFIIGYDGTFILHPEPAYVGTRQLDLTDPAGIPVVRELIRIARKDRDGGYFRYQWQKYSEGVEEPKLSFVKAVPQWEWIVGTGVYLDDIRVVLRENRDALYRDLRRRILFVLLLIVILIIGVLTVVQVTAKRTAGNMDRLIRNFEDAADRKSVIDESRLSFDEFKVIAHVANTMIDDRNEAESRLLSSLREKEALLKEIHHRVKNNLQIIASLLNIQASYEEQDGKAGNVLVEAKTRVNAMALIHEKLYQTERFSVINAREFIPDLVVSVQNALNLEDMSHDIDLDIEEIQIDLDRAIPCGLILNELITNAMKYAFPGSNDGTIRITMGQREAAVTLTVADNGVGLPESREIPQGSLGIQLVTALVDQLGGTYSLETEDGFWWTIEFPNNRRNP
jgi:two-component sensor histidine kinase